MMKVMVMCERLITRIRNTLHECVVAFMVCALVALVLLSRKIDVRTLRKAHCEHPKLKTKGLGIRLNNMSPCKFKNITSGSHAALQAVDGQLRELARGKGILL